MSIHEVLKKTGHIISGIDRQYQTLIVDDCIMKFATQKNRVKLKTQKNHMKEMYNFEQVVQL